MSSRRRRYELRARAEAQRKTRQRIVEATVELHRQVGPARTTVAEIARRAAVNRVTVYNHFPQEQDLFAACQAHFLGQHPLPDLREPLALTDPVQRVRQTLRAIYSSYREREPMTAKVLRDRAVLPELDVLLSRTMDAQQAALLNTLARGLVVRGAQRQPIRAILALALDFWSWQRLAEEGLDDDRAAELMASTVAHVAGVDGG